MADYVIVGAGSAGCVLAEALSATHSVVLIEAGIGDRTPEVAIPAAFSKLFKSERDWDLATEPETEASGRSLYLPRGKMLGGSSSMNAMLYIRGRPSDYDGWERDGAVGWGWQSVLPHFKAMETNSRGADPHHGDSGPIRVEDLRRINPLSRAFVEAAIDAGIPPNHDFNGARQIGAGFFQVTQRRGRRWSAADAFLRPAMGRPTLETLTNALAARIVVEEGRARAVECIEEGTTRLVPAELEVILCAGAFGSPHLLQLSGVGDPAHLRSLGIQPVVDSPEVGLNLQDHPVVPVVYESLQPGTLDDAENLVEKMRWLLFRSGRLTSPVAEACAFVKSGPDASEADIQFHFAPANFENHGMDPHPGRSFTVGPVLVDPASRGSVLARSADPEEPPAIRVNCLAAPGDIDALIRGVEIARDIVARAPFDAYRGSERKPGPAVRSRDRMEAFIRSTVELLYHPAGTCRMGSDDRAVVDPELKVNGVDGLRVADASVMPKVTSGNTNAPTMMIAARAAEMILAG